METKVGEAVLTPKISKTLAELQDCGVSAYCELLDRVIGTIIDLKVDNEVSADNLLTTIGEIRYLSYCLKELVPETQKGDEL